MTESSMWEARYRDLERQLEYMMIQAAEALETAEARLAAVSKAQARKTPAVRVRKMYPLTSQPDRKVVVCVADGANLAYRFSVLDGDIVVHEGAEQRTNAFEIPAGIRGQRVRVQVVSHNDRQTASGECKLGETK